MELIRKKEKLDLIQFNVEGRAPIIIGKSWVEIVFVKGQSINLNCTGHGSPRPDIQWIVVIELKMLHLRCFEK